jgi:hypothetical protein
MNERLSAMRCLVCNTEMVLMEAVQADPTTLPGFEHRTFLCPACHDVERRLAYAGARAPSATSHSGTPATNFKTGRARAPIESAWGKAVEKVLGKQMALNKRTHAQKRPDSSSADEKLGREQSGAKERPSFTKTIDLVSELNRIWDDPRPAADERLEPPPTPKTD